MIGAKVMSFFITIEGVEGAGKSTVISSVKSWLQELGVEFVLTREPGGTKVAEQIRHVILDDHGEAISDLAELLLVFAARAQHINQCILPALNANNVVVCDRFTDATYAYQGGGRMMNDQHIAMLENLVQGTLRPDLTILLDIDSRLGFQRVAKRNEKLDRIEMEELEFFDRVRQVYLDRAKANPLQYKVLDASRTADLVCKQVKEELEKRMINILNVGKSE